MHFESLTLEHDGYIEIKASADYSLESLYNFIEHIRKEALRTSARRVLVNSAGLRGRMTEADRFLGGQKIAEVLGQHVKTAIIMPPGDVTKLGEITAVNRGARLLVTDDHAEAVRWLLS